MRTTPRIIGAVLCLTAALTMSLGGCSQRDDATDEILHRLDTMQGEIEDLKGNTGSSTNDSTTTDDTASTSDSAPSTSTSTTPTDKAEFEAALTDLESRVSDAIATADAVTVPSTPADRPQAYFDATRPLEQLDDETDRLDDQIENAHRAKTIDRATMWALEDRLDAVDNQLDRAKDSLELRMGVDD